MTKNNNDWKIGPQVELEFKNGGVVVRTPFAANETQPFIGNIRFKNMGGQIIYRQGVILHGIVRNNQHISFNITDGFGTKNFTIPIDNLDILVMTQNNEKFKQRFRIQNGKLRG